MRQELGVVRPRGGSHPNDKDTMPGIEDQRASLATLAHGAKKTPKTLDEMTEVAQVIDYCERRYRRVQLRELL